jgi:hypothetical protein
MLKLAIVVRKSYQSKLGAMLRNFYAILCIAYLGVWNYVASCSNRCLVLDNIFQPSPRTTRTPTWTPSWKVTLRGSFTIYILRHRFSRSHSLRNITNLPYKTSLSEPPFQKTPLSGPLPSATFDYTGDGIPPLDFFSRVWKFDLP